MTTLDLDLLVNYLDGDDNEYGLDFAATHGFLTATVVGPELPNWLDHLFDNETAKIPAEILAQIDLWRADILDTLMDDELLTFPVEIEEVSIDSSLGDWSIGFIDALFLNETNDWFDIDEESVAMLTLPMMVFSGIDEEDEDLAQMRADEDLLDDLAEDLLENITKLYLLFHSPEK